MTDREELWKLNVEIAQLHGLTTDNMLFPDYANDIKAAWELLEEASKGYNIIKSTTEPRLKYMCRMWFTEGSAQHDYSETAPEAICLAYLRWKKHEI